MSRFDRFYVVDWSAGNDTGARPRKDAIWLGGVVSGQSQAPQYFRNRVVAFERLSLLIEDILVTGDRAMIGFDFPFGYPAGFAQKITDENDPLSLWDYYADTLEDTPQGNTRFELAARLNRSLPGVGPFWFNGTRTEHPGLPRLKSDRTQDHGLAERRVCEARAKGTFTCWQMGGAGAVGGQVMTGMSSLSRLRARFGDNIAVWPFEPLTAPVIFVEIWPSLIAGAVRAAGDPIKDRAQVALLSRALADQSQASLDAMLKVVAPEEGWILGLGHGAELEATLCPA